MSGQNVNLGQEMSYSRTKFKIFTAHVLIAAKQKYCSVFLY